MSYDDYRLLRMFCVFSWIGTCVGIPMSLACSDVVSYPLTVFSVLFFLAVPIAFSVALAKMKIKMQEQNAAPKLPMYYTIRKVPDDPSDPNSPCTEQIVLMSTEDILKDERS